ncbi:MAG TPA: hypothetical protein DEP46_09745, partial [Blastocatellia bacterium]|nr:hypothetical protein [Blastocatellia bacterium]
DVLNINAERPFAAARTEKRCRVAAKVADLVARAANLAKLESGAERMRAEQRKNACRKPNVLRRRTLQPRERFRIASDRDRRKRLVVNLRPAERTELRAELSARTLEPAASDDATRMRLIPLKRRAVRSVFRKVPRPDEKRSRLRRTAFRKRPLKFTERTPAGSSIGPRSSLETGM